MASRRVVSSIIGLLLILFGGWFLGQQLFPELVGTFIIDLEWPMLIIGAGILLFLIGIATGATGMAVPGTIVTGIGGLLYYQNATGDWTSWAYVWTLIPGFVGLGVILDGLFSGDLRRGLGGGLPLLIISTIMFAIFSSIFLGPTLLGTYWPVLLILVGVLMLLGVLFRRR